MHSGVLARSQCRSRIPLLLMAPQQPFPVLHMSWQPLCQLCIWPLLVHLLRQDTGDVTLNWVCPDTKMTCQRLAQHALVMVLDIYSL